MFCHPVIIGLFLVLCVAGKWWKADAREGLIRLGFLAATSCFLWWYPLYFFTTYEGHSDDRSGFALGLALDLCPLLAVVGAAVLGQTIRGSRGLAGRSRTRARLGALALYAALVSPLWQIGPFLFRYYFGRV